MRRNVARTLAEWSTRCGSPCWGLLRGASGLGRVDIATTDASEDTAAVLSTPGEDGATLASADAANDAIPTPNPAETALAGRPELTPGHMGCAAGCD
jgi:hypothetical protein